MTTRKITESFVYKSAHDLRFILFAAGFKINEEEKLDKFDVFRSLAQSLV